MDGEDSRLPHPGQGAPRRNPWAVDLKTPPLTETIWTAKRDRLGEDEDVIVCCVFYGNKYSVDYVHKLENMVAHNLQWKHSFVCLSDREIEGVHTIPLPPLAKGNEGWWQKVELFRPSLFPQGSRILYLDLDVIITGSLDELIFQWAPQPLTMIYNFGPNRGHCAHNSSVMMWTAGDDRLNPIWGVFQERSAEIMRTLHGDQCWMWRVLRENIANWPKEFIQSYKYDVRPARYPSQNARVVVFHGDPKPHQVRDEWAKSLWHSIA